MNSSPPDLCKDTSCQILVPISPCIFTHMDIIGSPASITGSTAGAGRTSTAVMTPSPDHVEATKGISGCAFCSPGDIPGALAAGLFLVFLERCEWAPERGGRAAGTRKEGPAKERLQKASVKPFKALTRAIAEEFEMKNLSGYCTGSFFVEVN